MLGTGGGTKCMLPVESEGLMLGRGWGTKLAYPTNSGGLTLGDGQYTQSGLAFSGTVLEFVAKRDTVLDCLVPVAM